MSSKLDDNITMSAVFQSWQSVENKVLAHLYRSKCVQINTAYAKDTPLWRSGIA